MTKDEAKVELVGELARFGLTGGEHAERAWKRIEDYAAACVSEALQPKRTGRLPDVGDLIEVLCLRNGLWGVSRVRDVRTTDFAVANGFADVDWLDMIAEGITWRWPDKEKGA